MAKKELNMEMGNLVCRFGQEKALLDLAEKVVIPSFTDDSLFRDYYKTRYFFYEVKIVKLANLDGEIQLGIAGRYIKDTTLEREQIFESGKGLIKDSGAIRSSPSALFLLILNCHRLVYVRETKDAPSKESFRSTLHKFLRSKHKDHLDELFEQHKKEREKDPGIHKVTRKELNEVLPPPSLELIPLTSEDSIDAFIKKYDVLKGIEITVSDRNDEVDNDPFFEQLQKRKDVIGSIKSTLKHNNNAGLNKDQVIKEVAEATAQGNQVVKLMGVDSEGDTLRGNNEKFQLRKPVTGLSAAPHQAANKLFESFIGLIEDGIVRIPETSQKAKNILASLSERFL